MSDKRITISLKGSSQSQPWTVLNVDDGDELLTTLADLGVEFSTDTTPLQAIAEANAQFQSVLNVANPSGRAPAPSAAGSDEPAQGAESTTPARQRGAAAAPSSTGYARRKATAGTGGRGGSKPKLTYEEASADCTHGERVRRAGNGARGPWVGYFCPTPKGDPNQCSPNFINPSDDMEG